MLGLIVAVLIIIVASAMCSGAEAALFSVSLVRARSLAQSKKASALALLSICENMTRPISTIVILNNIANIVGSILVGGIAADVLGSHTLGVFSAVLTLLVILFAEIIPKTLGERYCERIGLLVAIPIKWLTWSFTPVIWCIEHATRPLTRGNEGHTVNEAEIKLMARIGLTEGVLEKRETELIQRVFELNNVTASDVMSPRVTLTYLTGEQKVREVADDIIRSQHSRMLVTDGTRDGVTGLAMKNELLTAIVQGDGDKTVSELQHKVRFVPEAMRADNLLEMFQKERRHLAVVMDEYGGVAGVVTLEDVLEVLTGEIVDESDRTVDLQEVARRRYQRIQKIEAKKDNAMRDSEL